MHLDALVAKGAATGAMCRTVMAAAMRRGDSLAADAACAADDATRAAAGKLPRSLETWAQVVRLEVRLLPAAPTAAVRPECCIRRMQHPAGTGSSCPSRKDAQPLISGRIPADACSTRPRPQGSCRRAFATPEAHAMSISCIGCRA